MSQQGIPAAFPDRLGVPVEPYFWEQGGKVGHRVAVNFMVKVVEVPLGRRVAGKAACEPLVQGLLGLVVVRDALCVLPPCLQVTPTDAVAADGPVVNENLVCVLDDLDVVVDRVTEPDVGFDM